MVESTLLHDLAKRIKLDWCCRGMVALQVKGFRPFGKFPDLSDEFEIPIFGLFAYQEEFPNVGAASGNPEMMEISSDCLLKARSGSFGPDQGKQRLDSRTTHAPGDPTNISNASLPWWEVVATSVFSKSIALANKSS